MTALVKYRAENLIDHNGFRYQAKDGKASGLPYCPVCEAKGLFLKIVQDVGIAGHPYRCPSCKAQYGYHGLGAETRDPLYIGALVEAPAAPESSAWLGVISK
ncbi:hypothetical protein [Mesorhizobium caraganae]|uniref:hypothetical protein n=1 Tax=Mesorhizobium caraganae TaxID=483206 RepID=UPI001787432C|nr:hypothetical protein [Mesorhizobium caraganae]